MYKDTLKFKLSWVFHGEDPYHTETSALIFKSNELADFYMIETCIMKELKTQSASSQMRDRILNTLLCVTNR